MDIFFCSKLEFLFMNMNFGSSIVLKAQIFIHERDSWI